MLSIVSEEGQRAKQQMMPVAKYLAQLLLSFCLRHIEQKAASTPLVSPGLVVFHGCFLKKTVLFIWFILYYTIHQYQYRYCIMVSKYTFRLPLFRCSKTKKQAVETFASLNQFSKYQIKCKILDSIFDFDLYGSHVFCQLH